MTDLIKTLIKSKNPKVKNEVMRFLAVGVMSNQNRKKLSYYIGAALKGKINLVSCDAFCFNLGLVLLELCKPFLKIDSPLLKKIDPSYLTSGVWINVSGETPLCTKKYDDEEKEESSFDDGSSTAPKDYGTVTEFFFIFCVGVNTLLSPIFKWFEEIDDQLGDLEKLLKRTP